MSASILAARLRDRNGALERLLGVVRRRALSVESLSISRCSSGDLEVVLRPSESAMDRTAAELSLLIDLTELTALPPDQGHVTREMVITRVVGRGPLPTGEMRILEENEGDTVIEWTGTPSRMDDVLEFLETQGVLAGAIRTGEVVVPNPSVKRKAE